MNSIKSRRRRENMEIEAVKAVDVVALEEEEAVLIKTELLKKEMEIMIMENNKKELEM